MRIFRLGVILLIIFGLFIAIVGFCGSTVVNKVILLLGGFVIGVGASLIPDSTDSYKTK